MLVSEVDSYNQYLSGDVYGFNVTDKQSREELNNRPYRDWETDRKSTRLNSSHITRSRMPSSA